MANPAEFHTVAPTIRFLKQDFRRQASLEEVAAHVGLSPFHFQRIFSRWAGVSPKRFLQFLLRRLAAHIGQPGASRAVGSAVGKNAIAFLSPSVESEVSLERDIVVTYNSC